MQDTPRHPDDAALFDLVEDALDPAQARRIKQHLMRCAACAAFVRSAREGAVIAAQAAALMPAKAGERMHVRLAQEWGARLGSIAAEEAAHDAATEIIEVAFAPGERPPITSGMPPRTPRRRGRWLVPALAFVVLGALAGTSIYVGGGDPDSATPRAVSDVVQADSLAPDGATPATAESSAAAGGAVSSGDASAGAPTVSTPPGAGNADRDTAASANGSSNDKAGAAGSAPAVVVPPIGYDEFVDQDRVCVASLDQTALLLPDGRSPQQIIAGPLGIFLACG